MAKYIIAELAYNLARKSDCYSDFRTSMADLTSLKELLEDTPAADVVEVVRCKDCKYSTERQGFENHMWNDDCVMCDYIAPSNRIPMNKNAFCSYGERNGNNDN